MGSGQRTQSGNRASGARALSRQLDQAHRDYALAIGDTERPTFSDECGHAEASFRLQNSQCPDHALDEPAAQKESVRLLEMHATVVDHVLATDSHSLLRRKKVLRLKHPQFAYGAQSLAVFHADQETLYSARHVHGTGTE